MQQFFMLSLACTGLQGDLLALKQSIHRQLQLLGVTAAASANSVALIKDIDQVKGRLECKLTTMLACKRT